MFWQNRSVHVEQKASTYTGLVFADGNLHSVMKPSYFVKVLPTTGVKAERRTLHFFKAQSGVSAAHSKTLN